MIMLCASLFILNPPFITLNVAFVSPPLVQVSNAISYLQFQSPPYNRPAAVMIVAEHSKWTREGTNGWERGRDNEGKTTSWLHIGAEITTAEG